MGFTSYNFFIFFIIFFAAYWLMPNRQWKNALLVVGSYIVYAWVWSWHAAFIFLFTLVDYFLALGMERWKSKSALLTWIGVALNLGILACFKYYFFFNVALGNWLNQIGVNGDVFLMRIALPLGLSFYALKKIGYLLDIQRGTLKPARDFLAYAAYISFFPQIFSGPIDRPQKLLAQLNEERAWKMENLHNAWTLLVMGFFKKIVIANSVTVIVDQIYDIDEPSKILLLVAALGYVLQILADFSSYTDISRGLACLLGLQTAENFNRPYLALTPTEFWNRWHITLSSWLRDYIFFPLRRVLVKRKDVIPDIVIQSIPPLVTMLVSGLWHGVGWKFAVWGLYYGALIVLYQALGIRGDWKPDGKVKIFFAWLIMFTLTTIGMTLFHTDSFAWLWNTIAYEPFFNNSQELTSAFILAGMLAFYALPLILKLVMDIYLEKYVTLHALYYVAATWLIVIYINSSSPDFIYFQF
jgi:D-alanyl-lipoteichoic acid acyltransferase DltB (MBOAT superfamily)